LLLDLTEIHDSFAPGFWRQAQRHSLVCCVGIFVFQDVVFGVDIIQMHTAEHRVSEVEKGMQHLADELHYGCDTLEKVLHLGPVFSDPLGSHWMWAFSAACRGM